MSTTLDGKTLFDERDLRIDAGSPSRASVERAVAGLDGVLNIDLGQRTRTIRQRGVLHARSQVEMNNRIAAIASLIDGSTHTLRTDDCCEYTRLRVDAFKQRSRSVAGPGVAVEYEITYTQLGS